MAERPMGLETEYGYSYDRRSSGRDDIDNESFGLVSLARKSHRYLNGRSDSGIFLENGSRFYIDAGAHPEFCTPEVRSPFEVVRYIEAGDQILIDLVAKMPSEREARLFKCNVDYVSNQTWAAHENYGHRCDPDVLPGELIPHLASRLIYTGAGGFNPRSRGIEFCISPRVFHLDSDRTRSSTQERGIYHEKDEPLSKTGWYRMHVLCGESLCSHLASTLKLGTTALIVALVEGGKRPGADVRMKSPLPGMIDFCEDVSLQVKAKMESGPSMSALDIQWHYLRFAEAHLGESCLPAWAPRICEIWRDTLERLTRDGVAGVNTRLDWAIKHTLYNQHMGRRAVTFEELKAFNSQRTSRTWLKRRPHANEIPEPVVEPDRSEPGGPPGEQSPDSELTGLSDEQVEKLIRVRSDLFELEVRYGQLGDSLFKSMDERGLLDHRIPEITRQDVERAVSQPPDSGRARVRGELIKNLSPGSMYQCDWYGIWSDDGTWLDLSDPDQGEAPKWVKPKSAARSARFEDSGFIFLRMAQNDFDKGSFEAAFNYLERWNRQAHTRSSRGYRQLYARVQSRRGFLPAAVEMLDETPEMTRPRRYIFLFEMTILHRYEGIVPGTGFLRFLSEASEAYGRIEEPDDHERLTFQGAEGLGFLLRGDLTRAEERMWEAVSDPNRADPFPRIYTRIKTDLAEVYRRQGRLDQARRLLAEAEQIYQDRGFKSDLSDNVLLRRAKLEPDSSDAQRVLDQAEEIQTGVRNRLGLTKTHLLRARILDAPAEAERSHNQLTSFGEQLPVLRTCPLFSKIMDRWDDWTSGQQLLDEADMFWGM